MNFDKNTGILKMLDDFNRPATYKANFTYEHNHPKLIELADSYNLKQIAGGGDDLSKILNLLHWLSANTFHSPDYPGGIPFNALDLLEYTFNKGIESGVNCQCLATILTECYLSIGLKARTTYIMPFNPYDSDNHVVTIVFSEQFNKWIMVDPSYSAYMKNENDLILSPWEAREALANQWLIKINPEYNYNGSTTVEPPDAYIEYIAKDIFFFFCGEKSTFLANPFEPAAAGKLLTLAPLGFDVKKYMIENVKWRIRQYGENEGILNWLRETEKMEINYISFADFTMNP